MVVGRAALAMAVVLSATLASAQEPTLSVFVESTDIPVERQFWITVEASGPSVELPEIPQVDGLMINRRPTTSQQRMVMRNGRVTATLRVAYLAVATQPGPITVPALKAMIGGRPVYSDPIELSITGEPTKTPRDIANVRAWVDDDAVVMGVPFWLRLEATGGEVQLPRRLSIDGLSIDNVNVRFAEKSNLLRGSHRITRTTSFHCTAKEPGEVRVPPLSVVVDGQTIQTEAFTIPVLERAQPETVPVAEQGGSEHPTTEDLIFINMEVDRDEVYQGQPILLKTQLWRILERSIQSGPQRGSLIVPPSTEGFYVTYLDPISYVDQKGFWKYEVNEERKVLYPTAIGDLRVGQWHWEGIALGYRHNIAKKFRQRYSLNAGPIRIKVKPLPPRPAGFSGAVGQFDLEGRFDAQTLKQGVPAKLVLTVNGVGNPDAVGDPVVAALEWAQLSEPKRETDVRVSVREPYPTVTKEFTFELVPLRSGIVTVPAVEFIYFDPYDERYVTRSVGPYTGVVEALADVPQHVIMAAEEKEAIESVEILTDDIRGIAREARGLSSSVPRRYLPWLLALLPVVGYLLWSLLIVRRARLAGGSPTARAHRARSQARDALAHAGEEAPSSEELRKIVVQFISDRFALEEWGMTSADVRRVLAERSVEPELIDNAERILRACERVSYAGDRFSVDEWKALVRGASEFVDDLDRSAKS